MLEGFKINCYPLNRSIRVTIHLPKDYNNTGRFYPAIYFFDGQNVYTDTDSYTGKSLNLEETINALADDGKEAIYISIAAANNPEKRLDEYKKITLANFIVNAIHPYINARYRINNYIYAVGCGLSALNCLALNSSEVFKGSILISPEADIEDIKCLNLPKDNLYYLYCGEKELNGCSKILAGEIKKLLPNCHIVYDNNAIHDESAWKTKIKDALNHLVL